MPKRCASATCSARAERGGRTSYQFLLRAARTARSQASFLIGRRAIRRNLRRPDILLALLGWRGKTSIPRARRWRRTAERSEKAAMFPWQAPRMKMDFHASIKLDLDRQVQGYYEELQSLQLDTKFAGKLAGRREVVHAACGLTLHEARPRADRSWILAQVGARAPLLQAASGGAAPIPLHAPPCAAT